MKTQFSLAGSALAALGISLMAISCDNKSENADSGSETSDTGTAEAAPTGDLESHVIGYWAADAEAMMKEKGLAAEDNIDALRMEMFAEMAFEIPEKGKIVMHMLGDSLSMSYTVKTVDAATKTLTVEITDPDGETESGSIIIGEDKLWLSTGGDEPDLSLVRINEAAFKKRKVVLPNSLDLPEGPVEEPATEKAPAAEEKPDPAPESEAAAPAGDLESHVIGYWAPDAEAMMKELAEGLADDPDTLAATKAMMKPMLAAMVIEIPEKGTVIMNMMGTSQPVSYTVKSIDEATKTLTVEITDPDGEKESGSIIIGEDKLRIQGGDDGLSLVRIDEATFKKRQETKAPNILDLPEGLDPDAPGEKSTAKEAPAVENAPATEIEEAPAVEKAPATEEAPAPEENPDPAPEN